MRNVQKRGRSPHFFCTALCVFRHNLYFSGGVSYEERAKRRRHERVTTADTLLRLMKCDGFRVHTHGGGVMNGPARLDAACCDIADLEDESANERTGERRGVSLLDDAFWE